jgi:uncharacterized protein YwqG
MTTIWVLLLAAAAVLVGWWFARRARPEQVLEPAPVWPRRLTIGREATQDEVQTLLAPMAAALETSRRPMVRIVLEPMPDDDLCVSKVGGAPWWPAATPWPMDGSNRPLTLLAQVDFACLPRPLPGWPQQGLLQFFIGNNDVYGASFDRDFTIDDLAQQRDFRVVHWPQFDAQARGAGAGAETAPPFDGEYILPIDPARPRRMRFALGDETLTLGDYRMEGLFGGNWYAAIESLAAQHGLAAKSLIEPFETGRDGTGHKLGGYPHFTQVDPRREGPWELLLQLDTDDDMMWGDCGVANFFIDPARLARADFSCVAYNWDCS